MANEKMDKHIEDLAIQMAVKDMIQDIPSLNITKIIRCKDCKYRDPEDKKCDCGHDIIWQLPRDDNWYCANGKLKNE